MEPLVLVERDPSRAATVLTLNRPGRRNALNLALLHALREAVAGVGSAPPGETVDPGRVLVLRGAGPAFCAGLDLAETADDPGPALEATAALLLTLAACPLVTIAAVHGAAVAGGLGLVAACDLALMTTDCRYGLPEVRRGLSAALVAVFLQRQLRERDLRELLLAGELHPAEKALATGLVNRLVAPEALDAEVGRLTASVAAGGPAALAATKRWLDCLRGRPLAEECAAAVAANRAIVTAPEAREGRAAFLEKRPPRWTPPAALSPPLPR